MGPARGLDGTLLETFKREGDSITDEKLRAAEESGLIDWINNAWFEVAWLDNEDGEIVDGIDEAIEYAKKLLEEEV